MSVSPDEPIQSLVRQMTANPDFVLLMRVRVGEWKLLDTEDVHRLAADTQTMHLAKDVKSKGPLPMIFPDEALEDVLRWTGEWPVLPVVNRADLGKLEGVLTLPDILQAFRKAVADSESSPPR